MGGLRGGSGGGGRKGLELMRRLPHLQNLVRRDPSGYRAEFMSQFRNCKSEMEIVRLNPATAEGHRFLELLSFVSHCIACYVKEKETEAFPDNVVKLVDEKGEVLSSEIRVKVVQAIVLMRHRGLIAPSYTIKLAFRLFRLPDKALRRILQDYIVNDIKSLTTSSEGHKLDKELKAYLYRMLSESSVRAEEPALVRHNSLMVIVELYRRRVWVDERTVNIIGSVLDSQDVKLVRMALRFFLNIDQVMDDDNDNERGGGADNNPINYHSHAKKRSGTIRKVKKQIKAQKKAVASNLNDKTRDNILFPAMNLLHNPQGCANKMLTRLKSSRDQFEFKILMMNFISRVIATHKLLLVPFYSYVQRYLQSHQKEVTLVLTYLIQACHDQVPPDELMPVVKAILHNFVTERCPGKVIAVGINTIREVIRRCPSLLSEDGMDDLVRELVGYIKYKDKSVVVASRGFLNLIRQVYPKLLQGKDRGKYHDPSARPLLFGEQHVTDGVEGADLLTLVQEGVLKVAASSDNDEISQEDEEDEQQLSLNSTDIEDDDDDEPAQLVPSTEAISSSIVAPASSQVVTEQIHYGDEESTNIEEDEKSNEGSGVSLSQIRVDPKRRVDAVRSLSAEDFKRIKKLRAQVKDMKMGLTGAGAWKRNRDEDNDSSGSDTENDGRDYSVIVNPEDLQGAVTQKRKTAEERRAKVEAGRIAFHSRSHGGGLTNLEKQRRKNFLMVRKGQMKKGPQSSAGGRQKNNKQQFKRDKRKKRRT